MRAWPQVKNSREHVALSVHGCLGKALEAFHAASVQNTGVEIEEFSVYVRYHPPVGWSGDQAMDSEANAGLPYCPSLQPASLLGR